MEPPSSEKLPFEFHYMKSRRPDKLMQTETGHRKNVVPSQSLYINTITLSMNMFNLVGRKPGQGKHFSP